MITLIDPTNLRYVILASVLSERPINIIDIHGNNEIKGLRDYEIKFLDLTKSIMSGAKYETNKAKTTLKFYPGILMNNNDVDYQFDCGLERSIGYFLEPLMIMSLFGKSNLQVTLQGITNDELDLSVDTLIQAAIPLIKHFGVDPAGLSLKVIKRGFKPLGGGEIKFTSPFVKYLQTVELMDTGKIKKIRGVSYASKVSLQNINRIISKARDLFNDYIPDVWIYSDYYKGPKAGLSPGFGISLIAETTSGSFISCDEIYDLNASKEENLPENIGERVALRLLDEIYYSGFIDSSLQTMLFFLMALSEKRINKAVVGRISAFSVENLRIIRDFFGVTFKIENFEPIKNEEIVQEEQEENNIPMPKKMVFKCVGIGLLNIARQIN